MIQKPMDVLEAFPVRKSKKQKAEFRAQIKEYISGLGYPVTVEEGALGSRNLVIGNPESAKYLVTAHYDTCAHLPFPNLITPCNFWLLLAYQLLILVFMVAVVAVVDILAGLLISDVLIRFWINYLAVLTLFVLMLVGPANKHNANDNTSGVISVLEIAASMPENLRDRVCFVLFDLEEAGVIGSASYRKKHKSATNRQIVLNLDCVGDGDEIYFFPGKLLRKDASKLACLQKVSGSFGRKSITVRAKGFAVYPSDQANFPYGVGICALRRSRLGLYMSRIHTNRDTVLEVTNINILRAALISLIGSAAE